MDLLLVMIISLCVLLQKASSEIAEIKCMKIDVVEYLGLLDVKCYNISKSSTSLDSHETTLSWNVTEGTTNVNDELTTTSNGVLDLNTSTNFDLTSNATKVEVSTKSEESTVGSTLKTSTHTITDFMPMVTNTVITNESSVGIFNNSDITASTKIPSMITTIDETTITYNSTTFDKTTTNEVSVSYGTAIEHQTNSSAPYTEISLTSEPITSQEASKNTDVNVNNTTTTRIVSISETFSTTQLPIRSSTNTFDSTSTLILETSESPTDRTYAVQVNTTFTEFTKITTDSQIGCDITVGLNFKCKSYGRFLDESVPDCEGYIFCVAIRAGEFDLYRYKCPQATKFNNKTKMCTDNKYYDCPCTRTPSEISNNITSQSTDSLTTDINATTVNEIYEQSNGTLPIANSFESFLITTELISNNGNSVTIGNDISLTSTKAYSLPTEQLPLSTEYTTIFSSASDDYYQDTTSINTFSTENSAVVSDLVDTQLIVTEIPLITEVTAIKNISDTTTVTGSPDNIIQETTTTETSMEPTVIITESSTETTIFGAETTGRCLEINGLNFVCNNFGRFLDESVPNCKGYIYCALMKNGSYAISRYACPGGTTFNNNTKMCTANNECTCRPLQSRPNTTNNNISNEDTTLNVDLTTINESLTTELSGDTTFDKFQISSNDSTIIQVTDEIVDHTQVLQTLSISTTDRSVTDETPQEKIVCDVENGLSFQCSARGRFLDETVPGCGGYIYCVQLENATFILTRYRCPNGTFFNHGTLLCTEKYPCPCIVNTSNSEKTSIFSQVITSVSNESIPNTVSTLSTTIKLSGNASTPKETTISFFNTGTSIRPNLSAITEGADVTTIVTTEATNIISNTYIILGEDNNTTLNQGSASTGTIVTAITNVNESYQNNTQIPPYISTNLPSTTNIACGRPSIDKCTTTGRYADYTEHNCKNYIYCVNIEGIMETKLYTCPSIYIFDPDTNLCTDPSSYICPC